MGLDAGLGPGLGRPTGCRRRSCGGKAAGARWPPARPRPHEPAVVESGLTRLAPPQIVKDAAYHWNARNT